MNYLRLTKRSYRTKYLATLTIIFGLLSISSCGNADNKKQHPFISFISENYNYQFEDKASKFLVITNNGCGGCKEVALQEWLKNYSDRMYVAISYSSLIDMYNEVLAKHKNMVFVDQSGTLSRLNFKKGSFNLMFIKNGEVLLNKVYENPNNYPDVFSQYFKEIQSF